MLTIPLGPFELHSLIGVGGAGEVWQGVHQGQGVAVAVKVITAARARDPRYRDAFRNEVRAVAGLDHPGIVMVFDAGEVDEPAEVASRGRMVAGSPYLAMELAGRGSLRSTPLPGSWAGLRAWMLWLLDVLAHAHANGVIHRDLKPGNVLAFDEPVRPNDPHRASALKLTDFGLAYAAHRAERAIKGTSGTPIFMAPEQFLGRWRDFGPSTDLYSFGCMAYALASGAPPFRGKGASALARMHLGEDPPPLVPRIPTPPGFEALVRRLMHKEPAHRFQRAADVAWALLALGEPDVVAGDEAANDRLDASVGHTLTCTWHDVDALVELEAAGSSAPTPASSLPPLPATWRLDTPPAPNIRLIGAGLGLYGLRAVPLVGRDGERDRIWAELRAVRQSDETRLVVLRGAAGTGKTRLAQWIAQRADEVGNAVVLRATHSLGNGPADGLARMVASALGCVGLSRAEMADRLAEWLRIRGCHDDFEYQAILELVWPVPEEDERKGVRVVRFGSANERYALIRRILTLVARGAEPGARVRPVVVLLDDVQWGADALGFARYLVTRVGQGEGGVLVLCTVREESLHDREVEQAALAQLVSLPPSVELHVEPLDTRDRRELVQRLLYLQGDVAEQVIARTVGNPLFAVQLVGDWVQRGVLVVGETGFVLRAGERADLPDDIHQLWEDRIWRALDGRPADDRVALELAAAMGTDVEAVEWRGACRVAGLTLSGDLVAHLVGRRLARDLNEGWSYAHGMLRESLARSAREAGRWQRLHDACATTLQIRMEVARQPGVADRLGRHLFEAGRYEEALEPLGAGALERRAMSDYGGALALLDVRDDILTKLALPESDVRFGEGWVARADLLIGLGRLQEAAEIAKRAVEMGKRHRWEAFLAPASRHAASTEAKLGRLAVAEELLLNAEQFATDISDDRELARSVLFLGDVFRLRGRNDEAMLCCRRALGRFVNLGDRRGQADTLAGMAAICKVSDQLELAERYAREAIPLYEGVGGRFGVASARNTLGDVLRARGDLDGAIRGYRDAEHILRALGSPEYLIPVLNQGLLHVMAGRFSKARPLLDEVLTTMTRTGRRALAGVAHAALIACAANARDVIDWRSHVTQADALLRETGLVDPDIAESAEIGAREAEAAGLVDGVSTVWALAAWQWDRLGRTGRAAAAAHRAVTAQSAVGVPVDTARTGGPQWSQGER